MQGRFHGYTPLATKTGEILNSDKIGLPYKDFITGPDAESKGTWGGFGVDLVTGPGQVRSTAPAACCRGFVFGSTEAAVSTRIVAPCCGFPVQLHAINHCLTEC